DPRLDLVLAVKDDDVLDLDVGLVDKTALKILEDQAALERAQLAAVGRIACRREKRRDGRLERHRRPGGKARGGGGGVHGRVRTSQPAGRSRPGISVCTLPPEVRSEGTRAPNTTPPTWAKNATPPPLALAPKMPKFASTSWYRNQAPRKN